VRGRNRGAALLLVLAAVALLAALAVEIASRASADSLRATRASRDGAFRRLFDSATEVGRGLLVEPEPQAITYWGQSWNREARFSLATGQEAVVRVQDDSGKLNIARAISHPEEALAIQSAARRLFAYLARHSSKDKVKWNDLGDKVLYRLSSPEPLLSLDGLRESDLELSLVFGSDGLARYLTCFGDGKINLNTAPKAVLASIDPEFDDDMVERVSRYRGTREGEPGAYKPFEEPQDLMLVEGIVNRSVGADGQLHVDRNLFEKVKSLISVKSTSFSVRIEAAVDGRRRNAWAFFKTEGSRIAFEEVLP
jgi:type II secretory pathway component PulK